MKGIVELRDGGWDDHAGTGPLRSAWLRTQTGRAAAERYVIDGEGEGIAAFFLRRGTTGPSDRAIAGEGARDAAALVCDCPGSDQPGFAWPDGGPLPVRWLIDVGESLAAQLGATSVVFQNLDRRVHEPLCEALDRAGYECSVAGHDAVLDLGSLSGFDDYLGTLPRNRRTAVRRERRDLERGGVEIERHPATRLREDLAVLQAEHHARHGLEPRHEGVLRKFADIRRFLPDDVVVLTAGAPPVGYTACVFDGPVVRVVLCGIGDAAPPFTYFSLVYYEVIELCLDRGVRTVRFGTESYDAKRRRGCRLIPLERHAAPVPSLSSTINGEPR